MTFEPKPVDAKAFERDSKVVDFQRSYELKSISELASYNAPLDAILLRNCHLVKGGISILAGHPGIGKSRAGFWLAVSGAIGAKNWMGFPIHRQFKTLIIQNENGSFRLKDEASAILEKFPDVDFDENIKISLPPERGLSISDIDFQETVKSDIEIHNPDLVILDPWTSVVPDDTRRDYMEALKTIRKIIPPREVSPAILVIAHCRKPQGNHRVSGRDLLHTIAGSFVLGAAARSAFVLEAGDPDPSSNSVVLTDAKCNDGEQIGITGWVRHLAHFEQDTDFDLETWRASFAKSDKGSKQAENDEQAFELLNELGDGGHVGLNKWAEACKEAGFYKSKPTLKNAADRLLKAGRIAQDKVSEKYYPIHPPGTFSH